ncbi:hypothetical protein CLU79DRAFT_732481 [Phycomyces nitens]|nr:hypothetical protein CLU79DRAFT_732481 [Phycomyces nitens]
MRSYTSAIVLVFCLLAISLVQAHPVRISKRGTGAAIHVNSGSAFCSYLPPNPGENISDTENDAVPFCTSTSLAPGSKKFPTGFIKSAHYLSTGAYAQVTGKIDRTKYKLSASDGGGQYDNKDLPKGTCNGYKYFVNLIEPDANVFCIRCCSKAADCKLGISTYGCQRIVPGNYS